jgi:hypothetical protein
MNTASGSKRGLMMMNAEMVVKLADFNARELGLKWMITRSRDIRLKKDGVEYCPLEVAGNFESWSNAEADLTLGAREAQAVMCGADDVKPDQGCEPKRASDIRTLMLNTFEFEVMNGA